MSTPKENFDEAFAKHHAGDIGAAAQLYRAVLNEQPEHPDALHMLSIIAQQKKNPDLALQLIDLALAYNSNMPAAWNNRSLILRVLGRQEQALTSALRSIEIDPNYAEGWNMSGILLRELGRLEESRTHHLKAIDLQANNPQFQINYAVTLLALNDLEAAYRAACQSQKLDKSSLPLTLGNILQASGYPEKAISCFQKSCEILPDITEARLNEATARLLIGDFEKGWKLWELREDHSKKFQCLPRWNGGTVKHLLVYEDQGMGDVLQCIRYLPLLSQYAEKITVQVTDTLKELLAHNFTEIVFLSLEEAVPKADACVQFMSLPYHFKTNLSTIPKQTPPLQADERKRMVWRDHLKLVQKPRIGLVWGGNPAHRNDVNRSIQFLHFKDTLKTNASHFVSLQKNRPKDQADLKAFNIFDAELFLKDFADTAALISELDLVISVDTATIHLAGAMGKPAWLLLPFEPEWRWMYGREDSPWYPTLRLFRQEKPRNWIDVLRGLSTELQKFITGDATVLQPTCWRREPLKQNPYAVILPEIENV